MSRFEFNLVLVSIMLALAATEQLAVWGRVLRKPTRFGFSWPYLLSSLWVLLSLVLHWFHFWAYREVDVNQARYLFLLILPSLVLALCSFSLAPDLDTPEPILENHWNETSGRLMLVFGAFLVAAPLVDVLLPGPLAGPPTFVALLAAGSLLAASLERLRPIRPFVVGLLVALQTFSIWNLGA
jgi:hypothetical protein